MTQRQAHSQQGASLEYLRAMVWALRARSGERRRTVEPPHEFVRGDAQLPVRKISTKSPTSPEGRRRLPHCDGGALRLRDVAAGGIAAGCAWRRFCGGLHSLA
jgi:hypothetical protein